MLKHHRTFKMVAINIAIVFTMIPFFAFASLHPPHLRHRRLANSVRLISRADSTALATYPIRANEAHAEAHRVIKRQVMRRGKSCQPRQESNYTATDSSTSSATWSASTGGGNGAVAALATGGAAAVPTGDSTKKQKSTTSTASWSQTSDSRSSSPTPSLSGNAASGGLLQSSGPCGWCDSNDQQPNGSEDWLNCGLDNGGWNPPKITLNQLIAADLSADGVFAPCAQYFDRFQQYGDQYGIKPIMLASFAMQESTCNSGMAGGNGEAGLMQLASENCGGAPGNGGCWDVDFDIQTAAKLFAGLVSTNNNNVVAAVGSYNGWKIGMTHSDATAAAGRGDCSAQNNLDYLYQFFNGWMQGKNGYDLGTILNMKTVKQ